LRGGILIHDTINIFVGKEGGVAMEGPSVVLSVTGLGREKLEGDKE
jgi:hypothetical protein